MRYRYREPGALISTPHTTESLEADLAAGIIQADWRFQPEGDSKWYTLKEAIAAEAAVRAHTPATAHQTPAQHPHSSEDRSEAQDEPPVINDRFPVLSSVAAFLCFVGWLIAGGGAIFFVVAVAKAFRADTFNWWDIAPVFISLLVAAIGALIVATGEIIGVLFAIESNTRLSAERLSRLRDIGGPPA